MLKNKCNYGLNEYDFTGRWQDPGIPSFTSIDPLCEKYYSVSPYVYCLNNPLKYVDSDGKEVQYPPGNGYWNWSREKQNRVAKRVNATNIAANNVFKGSGISLSKSFYSLSTGLSMGPVKGKVSADFGKLSVKMTENQLSVTTTVGEAKATFSANSTSLNAEVSVVEMKAVVDENVNIDAKFELTPTNANIKIGDDANITMDDNAKIGFNVKAGVVKAGLSLDLKAAGQWLIGTMNTIVDILTPEINVNTKKDENRY